MDCITKYLEHPRGHPHQSEDSKAEDVKISKESIFSYSQLIVHTSHTNL